MQDIGYIGNGETFLKADCDCDIDSDTDPEAGNWDGESRTAERGTCLSKYFGAEEFPV